MVCVRGTAASSPALAMVHPWAPDELWPQCEMALRCRCLVLRSWRPSIRGCEVASHTLASEAGHLRPQPLEVAGVVPAAVLPLHANTDEVAPRARGARAATSSKCCVPRRRGALERSRPGKGALVIDVAVHGMVEGRDVAEAVVHGAPTMSGRRRRAQPAQGSVSRNTRDEGVVRRRRRGLQLGALAPFGFSLFYKRLCEIFSARCCCMCLPVTS